MSRGWILAAACMACAYVVGQASASPVLPISYSYVTDTPSITAAPSSPVTVSIFLQENLNSATTSLLVSQDGLFGGGVLVQPSVLPSQPTTVTSVSRGAAFTGGFSAVAKPGPSFPSAGAMAEETVPFGTGPDDHGAQPTDLGGGVQRVLLFTFHLTTGNLPNQATTFSIAKTGDASSTVTFLPNQGDTGNGYDLDVTNNGTVSGPPNYTAATTTTFTVTTTPEPACLAPLGLGLLALRRRRA